MSYINTRKYRDTRKGIKRGLPERNTLSVKPAADPHTHPIGQLRFNQCCWPAKGTTVIDLEPARVFCGKRVILGRPYCAQHTAIAYIRVRV